MKRATELEYLRWFFDKCDFGPAHGDVIYSLNEEFVEETGKLLPKDYSYDEEES